MNGIPICVFCHSKNSTLSKEPVVYFNEKIFHWHGCNNCKLRFLFPALSEEDIATIYKLSYHETFYFPYTVNYDYKIQAISKFNKKTILDYGCGDGRMLAAFQQLGYAVAGVEYNAALVDWLTAKYTNAQFYTTAQFWAEESTKKYDIIHLGDVLEHLPNPAATLYFLQSKLAEDGVFFMDGPLELNPNFSFFIRQCTIFMKRLFYRRWAATTTPTHVWLANASNQLAFFNHHQLTTLEYRIYEQGFPYVEKWKEVKSLKLFFQWAVANTSMAISKLIARWGNRFIFIGQLNVGESAL
jgi:2-polyprenyl-3-methyl-5-hydroxy-6-metoxy-1,4-benzoquinol methylase